MPRLRFPGGWVFLLALAVVLATARAAFSQLVINEFLASNVSTSFDEDGDSSDWVELENIGVTALEVADYAISDDVTALRKWPFPELVLPPGGRMLVWCSGKDRRGVDADAIEGIDSSVPFAADLISLDDEWRYFAGPTEGAVPDGWTTSDFEDSAWPRGLPGFGFGDGDDETEIDGPLSTVLLRRSFQIESLAARPNLVFQARYDDAFVLYLNGTRVLSVNFPSGEEPTFASRALRSTEARRAYRFDLTEWTGELRQGENVVAIAVINSSPTSADLSMIPELGSVPVVLHSNFRLESSGEWIFVTDPRGEVVDGLQFPRQYSDQSYGRVPDGTGEFHYLLEPSPLGDNRGAASTEPLLVQDTAFEPDRGFYTEPIEVTITTPTEGAEIRYTLDGSAPTATSGRVYRGPIPVADTTTLRAAAFFEGLRPTNVDTHTYIFVETPAGGGVLNQPRLPSGFPSTWGTRVPDYEMDPRIATDEGSQFFDPRVEEGLLSLPSLSLVMDIDDLFDPATGIYSNPQREGVEWERPTSVELIFPDGKRGFQVNAGLRMQGNASRNPNRPKHNMRLLFKQVYGAGKLRYPIFTETSVDEFDTIVLRGGNGDSWFHPNVTQQVRAQYIRDQWHRDTERDMGRLRTHQEYMHLYINGLYWGLYHIFERPNASFLASYLGGEEEEYDSRNARQVVDGDLGAWNEMWNIANAGVASSAAYARIHEYLDVTNLIDFLLINFYSGNVDWDNNNWFGGRRRVPGAQYRFFCWDAERTYWNTNENRTTLNNASRPTGVHQRLRANAEYRLLFADRIQRHFFNDGALTPDATDARWMERAREIEAALSSEAARWGDNKRPSRPYTRDVEWAAELAALRRDWFPRRTTTVFNQLRSQGLYSSVEAPEFSRHGGAVEPGFRLRLAASSGTIWFTLDGSDPRLPGGAVADQAVEWDGTSIVLDRSSRVQARARDGNDWSALADAVFAVPDATPLRITEIMYNPLGAGDEAGFEADDFEFVEIQNVGDTTLDLSGVRLAGGIEFAFSDSGSRDLEPGAFVVVVENLAGFQSRYGSGDLPIAGVFRGRLNDGGESLRIVGALGEVLHEVHFDDAWHDLTDGGGHSLVNADPSAPWDAPSTAEAWLPSRDVHGSPGRDDADVVEPGGGRLPGDLSRDGRVDLSDVVSVARILFGGLAADLGCADTPEGVISRQRQLDVNGDGDANISDVVGLATFLFAGGAEPGLGTACVGFPDCNSICEP